jgi:hypothetical protein
VFKADEITSNPTTAIIDLIGIIDGPGIDGNVADAARTCKILARQLS